MNDGTITTFLRFIIENVYSFGATWLFLTGLGINGKKTQDLPKCIIGMIGLLIWVYFLNE